MNRTIFIIAFTIAVIFGGSYFFLKFSPHLYSKPWIKPLAEVYGLIEEPHMPESYNAVFCIFDPSGSGKSTYSVPIITVDFIRQLITGIESKGYGDLWLTFIGRSAFRNKVIHFTIPTQIKSVEPPVRHPGERKGEYDKRMAQFRADSSKMALENELALEAYNTSKELFLLECSDMISKAYAPKKRSEDYSDIIGSLNVAMRSLATVNFDSASFRSILLISDGVESLPQGDLQLPLPDIPDDVLLAIVNHSGSRNSVVSEIAVELDNLDRGIQWVIRVYKPENL